MIFYTQFNRPKTTPIQSSPDKVDDYRLGMNEFGIKCLVKVGSHSRQDYIQSYAESCDVNKIVERCLLTEDFSPLRLNELNGQVTDLTTVPKTLRDLTNLWNQGQQMFSKLTADQKKSFGSVEAYIMSLGQSTQVSAARSSVLDAQLVQKSDGGDA